MPQAFHSDVMLALGFLHPMPQAFPSDVMLALGFLHPMPQAFPSDGMFAFDLLHPSREAEPSDVMLALGFLHPKLQALRSDGTLTFSFLHPHRAKRGRGIQCDPPSSLYYISFSDQQKTFSFSLLRASTSRLYGSARFSRIVYSPPNGLPSCQITPHRMPSA